MTKIRVRIVFIGRTRMVEKVKNLKNYNLLK
jgi:hypothetical protein